MGGGRPLEGFVLLLQQQQQQLLLLLPPRADEQLVLLQLQHWGTARHSDPA